MSYEHNIDDSQYLSYTTISQLQISSGQASYVGTSIDTNYLRNTEWRQTITTITTVKSQISAEITPFSPSLKTLNHITILPGHRVPAERAHLRRSRGSQLSIANTAGVTRTRSTSCKNDCTGQKRERRRGSQRCIVGIRMVRNSIQCCDDRPFDAGL